MSAFAPRRSICAWPRRRWRGGFAHARRTTSRPARRPVRSSRSAASPAPHALNALAPPRRPRVRVWPVDAGPAHRYAARWSASVARRLPRACRRRRDRVAHPPRRRPTPASRSARGSGVRSKNILFSGLARMRREPRRRPRASRVAARTGAIGAARAVRERADGELARARRWRRSRRRGGRRRRPRRRKKFAHFCANRLVRRETRRLSAAPPTGANGRSERARARLIATLALRCARAIKKFRCAESRAKYSFQRVRKNSMRCDAR